ncbi:MAG: ABC transporter substrate-binding protein [Promethearchaeota archaeon]
MDKKSAIISLVLIVVVSASTGLIGYQIALNNNNVDQPDYYYSFTDTSGRTVKVPYHPLRIISMAPSITETLFALGVQDRLIGVTDYCNYPAEAKNITSIGGFSTPDLEKIVALKPDLVISATYNKEAIEKIENLGIALVVMQENNTIESIIQNIFNIGKLVDAELNASSLKAHMYQKLWNITNQTATINESSKLKVYFEIWETPMAVGNQSFINDMIIKAGGKNIFGNISQQYPTVQNEDIINLNPDVIFITQHSAAWYSQSVCNRTGYNNINACINNRVYSVDDDMYLRPGPRIVDALENMTDYLYPGLL